MRLDYSMLDAHKECVPGYEDSSGGHITFPSGAMKLRTSGPSSSTFDSPDYDQEKTVDFFVDKLWEEFEHHGKAYLRAFLTRHCIEAKAHCDDHHGRKEGDDRANCTASVVQ